MLRVLEDNTVIEISLPESAAGFFPETRSDKKSTLLAGSSKEQTFQAVGASLAMTVMEMGGCSKGSRRGGVTAALCTCCFSTLC